MFHWDDRRHSAFDDTPLRLASIAGTDSFFYCVAETPDAPCAVKGVLADRKYHFFNKPLGYLNKVVADDVLLCAEFAEVRIAVRGIPFVVADVQISNSESSLRERLNQVADLAPTDKVMVDHTTHGFVIAYAVPQVFQDEAHNWFSNANLMHVITGLIDVGISASRTSEGPVMLINVGKDLLEMVCCKDGQILFVNHYRITGPEDVLYYVMAILQQLEISRDQIHVQCAGPDAGAALSLLMRYLPQCLPFRRHDITLPPGCPEVEAHDLIAVLQCVS